MAATAVEAEFAVVHVIGSMTIGAPASQPGLRGQWPPVAAVALHFEVCTLQGEVRLSVVIELPFQPVHRVVAQGTVSREAIRVRVAFAMALVTFGRRVAEYM